LPSCKLSIHDGRQPSLTINLCLSCTSYDSIMYNISLALSLLSMLLATRRIHLHCSMLYVRDRSRA
jgi:hypothetical protein